MKKHISRLFLPIYEDYFSKLKEKVSLKEIEQIADAIFHEREFNEWLKNKYKNELTNNKYHKYVNEVNFKIYLKTYNATKNREDQLVKRKSILDQLKLEKLKPISKHEYDVDMVDAYLKIESELNIVKYIEGLKKEEYLETIKYPIINYCQKADLPYEAIIQMKYPIVVTNTIYGFEAYLGRTLIAFDINKIEAILSYQNAKWQNKNPFASFVEHLVYNFINKNSPFDNNVRLSKIMFWVDKNRHFLPPDNSSNRTKDKSTALNYGIIKTIVSKLYYWPYSKKSLNDLYKALISNNKIKENKSFILPFKKYSDFPTNLTEWKASQVELMYLLYLIYNKKQHNSQPLHNIAMKLFKKIEGDFDQKGLNTTFNQLINDLETNKELSTGLKSIDDIFSALNLQ